MASYAPALLVGARTAVAGGAILYWLAPEGARLFNQTRAMNAAAVNTFKCFAALCTLFAPLLDANAYDPLAEHTACSKIANEQQLLGNARSQYVQQCMAKSAASAPPMIGPGRQASQKELEPAKEAVANRMKDPGSTQFRNVSFHEGTQAVCGEVNAKNSFGGYVGFRAFSYVDGRVTVMPSTGDSLSALVGEAIIRKACEN
jgi:hypothetical protein